MSNVRVYFSYRDLFGVDYSPEAVRARISAIPLETALGYIGALSRMVEQPDAGSHRAQEAIVGRLGLDHETQVAFLGHLSNHAAGVPQRLLFTPHHIAAAARLALEWCTNDGPALQVPLPPGVCNSLLQLIVGSADAPEHQVTTQDGLLSFALRHHGVMDRPVALYSIVRQWDILTTFWSQVHGQTAARIKEEAFTTKVGLSPNAHLRASFGMWASLAAEPLPEVAEVRGVRAEELLETLALSRDDAASFLRRYSADPTELRSGHIEELKRRGPGIGRSTVFDRRPFLRLASGAVEATSLAAVERLCVSGIYWESRALTSTQAFTAEYGKAAEAYCQESVRRMANIDPAMPRYFGESTYGRRRTRKRSSDAHLMYQSDREIVAFEAVTGRLQEASFTRGDIAAFRADVKRLISDKAIQLARCQRDSVFYRELRFEGSSPSRFWPVLVLMDEFPTQAPIYGHLLDVARKATSWVAGQPQLSIMTADELAALERHLEGGASVTTALRAWSKLAPRQPLTEWLRRASDGNLGYAKHHRDRWDALFGPWNQQLGIVLP